MKSLSLLAGPAALAAASGAGAESFTSTFTNETPTVIAAPGPTPATSMMGAFWKGTTTGVGKSSAMCWGALVGETGKYAGKTGDSAQYGVGDSGTAEGAWKD